MQFFILTASVLPITPFYIFINQKELTMMKFFLKLSLAILCPILLKANLCNPNSLALEELIELADYVIEGNIVEQHSFWNAAGNDILTAHQIKVKQSTGLTDQLSVTLLTKGGCVDGDCMMYSGQTNFQVGDYGVFFTKQFNAEIVSKTGYNYLSLVNSQSNFINLNNQLDAVNIQHKNFSAQAVFDEVEKQTGKRFAYQQQTQHELAFKNTATITTISPLSLPADGKALLTIRGTGFGNLSGNAKIYMLNPNYASRSVYVPIPKSYITRWNNQVIQIKVPGFDIRTNFPGVASGSVKIMTSNGSEVISTQQVNVTYNQKKLDNQSIDLISHSNNGEIPFYVSHDLRRDGALPAIQRAFDLWYCKTGIKFNIAGYVNNTCYMNDSKNVISYDDGCSITQLGFTRLAISTCGSKNDPYLRDLDIIINRNKRWSFDLENDAYNTSDFASTILHEMGHAHLLGHVLNKEDILFPVVIRSNTKLNLNDANLTGGSVILAESSKQNACTNYQPVSIFKSGSCCSSIQNDRVNYVSESLAIISFVKDEINDLVSVRYRKAANSPWSFVSTNKSFALLNRLEACANYEVQVSDACGDEVINQFTRAVITFETKGCEANLNEDTNINEDANINQDADVNEEVDINEETNVTNNDPSCEAPKIESASVVNNRSILIQWNAAPNNNSYEIQYRIGNSSPWTLYNSNYTRFTALNLDECAVFQYRMRSNCGDEVSAYTPISTVRTYCGDGGKLQSNGTNEVEFVVAPNPVKNQLLIIPQQVDMTNAVYHIKDITGRTIHAATRLPENYLINSSNLVPGMYFIEIVKNEMRFTQRFIKE